MSDDINWDINSYREDHESDEHWSLRRAFMARWKSDYPEERLVCLARVFANMELLGCRYPLEVMQQVSNMAVEVAKDYRNSRKDKLKRTFVSASDAAEDRAKGVKREGGVVVDTPPAKSSRISFVRQGQNDINDAKDTTDNDNNDSIVIIDDDNDSKVITIDYDNGNIDSNNDVNQESKSTSETLDPNEYFNDLSQVKCVDIRRFNDRMFYTCFGRFVLLVRPWTNKFSNLQASCQACNITMTNTYEDGAFSISLNGRLLARASGATKAEAKSVVETIAWNRLKQEVVSVLFKKQWIAQNESRISASDVTGNGGEFGKPIENSVAAKMMQMMGWKGGGLGADAQGIAEPIKPHLQMVNRAGLGSQTSDMQQMKRSAISLMQRFLASDCLDVDLVFSSDFSKEERATLHQVAQRTGLNSRSYGPGADRFLVVKKKLDPFSLVKAVIEKGGNTPKYQVFIPVGLAKGR